METCALCGLPVVCGHHVSIDLTRHWRVCCLCVGELLARLTTARVP